jgi:hypothetical protein
MYHCHIYCKAIMLLKGHVCWNEMHTNCHMLICKACNVYALYFGTCPVVVRALDVRLRITCVAKGKTTGLGTPWKWYKRGTPSDNPSSLLFGLSYTPETTRRFVVRHVARGTREWPSHPVIFVFLFVNTSVLNILPCLSNNSTLVLNPRSQAPTNAFSEQNPGYVH